MKAGQQVRDPERARGGHHAQPHAPAGQLAQLLDGVAHALHRPQGGPRMGQDGGADLGEADLAAGAVQQRLAQLALELAHLGADPRLGDVHAGGRAREAGLLGHRHEVLELPQLHNW